MGFEKRVLDVVGKVLKEDDTANFAYGTLFVPGITAREATKIETALIKEFRCGVIVSPCSNEFAFDFV
jgi:hypothetical protein